MKRYPIPARKIVPKRLSAMLKKACIYSPDSRRKKLSMAKVE
jgi:hypothetical protein